MGVRAWIISLFTNFQSTKHLVETFIELIISFSLHGVINI